MLISPTTAPGSLSSTSTDILVTLSNQTNPDDNKVDNATDQEKAKRISPPYIIIVVSGIRIVLVNRKITGN
jgi:hypothetical protein